METYKILLLTRVSRLEYLKDIYHDIISKTQHLESHIKLRWGLVFDLNRINPIEIDKKWLFKITSDTSQLEVYYMYASSDDAQYGANLANMMIKSPKMKDITHVYLLDDDNTLHPNFENILNKHLSRKSILFFSQMRASETGVDIISITPEISSDNCVGWVDSAQFVLPIKDLLDIGGYAVSYYIDGYTIRELLSGKCSYKCIDEVGSYYNYFTQLQGNI